MQDANQRRTNSARTEATKRALISAARDLFIRKGYADTSTPEIVKAAGITRGALYHHFEDKADLFRAVVRAEFSQIAAEIDASAADQSGSPIDALILGSKGYLDAMRVPGRTRIILLDGPAVLGRMEMDAIDQETSADTLRQGLKAAMDAGEIKELPLDVLTPVLSAVFDRAALGVADGDDPNAHLEVFRSIFTAMR